MLSSWFWNGWRHALYTRVEGDKDSRLISDYTPMPVIDRLRNDLAGREVPFDAAGLFDRDLTG
jgi:hypothetical protein